MNEPITIGQMLLLLGVIGLLAGWQWVMYIGWALWNADWFQTFRDLKDKVSSKPYKPFNPYETKDDE